MDNEKLSRYTQTIAIDLVWHSSGFFLLPEVQLGVTSFFYLWKMALSYAKGATHQLLGAVMKFGRDILFVPKYLANLGELLPRILVTSMWKRTWWKFYALPWLPGIRFSKISVHKDIWHCPVHLCMKQLMEAIGCRCRVLVYIGMHKHVYLFFVKVREVMWFVQTMPWLPCAFILFYNQCKGL